MTPKKFGSRKRRKFEETPSKFIYGGTKVEDVDYKEIDLVSKLVTPYGKLLSRKRTGATAKLQRRVTIAVKRARFLGLLPYVSTTMKD